MNVLAQIEQSHFIASADEIEKLAGMRFDSQAQADRAQGTYLRVLVAATQKAIQGRPTLRTRRKGRGNGTLSAAAQTQQLEAFEATNALYYAAVIRGSVTPEVADSESLKSEERRERSLARNRRTNYARTTALAIRNYLRAGLDLTVLVVPAVTKGSLVAAAADGGAPADPTLKAQRAVTRLLSQIAAVGETKAGAAREILHTAMAKSAELYEKLGGKATTKPAQALAESRPLKTDLGTFFPASIQ